MTTPLRVVIADDEPPARARIAELLEGREDVEVVAETENGRQTVATIRELEPDLVFLDVQMPGMSGLEVVEALDREEIPAIVFVTAFDAYAVRAFEMHAVDYLLKPFDGPRFEESLRRARARVVDRRHLDEFVRRLAGLLESVVTPARPVGEAEGGPIDRLVVRDGDRSVLVPVDRVDWIEAAGHCVAVHLGAETRLVDDTLTRLERRLDDRFVRIHRSTIVNLDRVAEFQRLFHGDFAVVLRDGTELKLSRTYRGSVEARLGRTL